MVDENETVAGAQAGETPQAASPPPGYCPPPSAPPCPPPLTGAAAQAAAEYQQIARELGLGVASLAVAAPASLQGECLAGFWCLPDVSCSARDFSSQVQEAFDANHQCLPAITL